MMSVRSESGYDATARTPDASLQRMIETMFLRTFERGSASCRRASLLGFVAINLLTILLPASNAGERVATAPDKVLEPLKGETVTFPLKGSLGTSDFTLELSLDADRTDTHDLGDLVSLWNQETRNGFTLGLRNNTGSTTSQANWRQLQFGIDAGSEPTWRDEGRPGAAVLGFSIVVHEGSLYVGTCETGDAAGQVYRYAGPGQWERVGPLDRSNAVTALATFEGQLYAGTGKYRLGGSALTESANTNLGGRVYRFIRPGEWELVGELPSTEAVAALVTYGGRLYASSLYRPAGFFRYDGERSWTSIPTPDGRRVNALGVHGGYLYATSYDSGAVYRFDGTRWTDLGLVDRDVTQNYSFATFQNALHVSTWPSGKVYRLGADDRWIDRGQLGDEQEVMGMLVHNGSFYAGTLPKAEVYRLDGKSSWTRLKQLDETPDVKFRRVWTMATYQGRLFATTLPSGKVWSMSAGSLVTHDRELASGWHDVVAERRGRKLLLTVDGQKVAEAETPETSLATEGLRLTIGEGPRGRFPGRLKNVRFESR